MVCSIFFLETSLEWVKNQIYTEMKTREVTLSTFCMYNLCYVS